MYLHTYQYYIYVVDVAFEVLADVINIVNYSFNAQSLRDEGAVNDFCFLFLFFFCWGVEDYFIALSLSLLDLIQHLQVYSLVKDSLTYIYIPVTHLCGVQ